MKKLVLAVFLLFGCDSRSYEYADFCGVPSEEFQAEKYTINFDDLIFYTSDTSSIIELERNENLIGFLYPIPIILNPDESNYYLTEPIEYKGFSIEFETDIEESGIFLIESTPLDNSEGLPSTPDKPSSVGRIEQREIRHSHLIAARPAQEP